MWWWCLLTRGSGLLMGHGRVDFALFRWQVPSAQHSGPERAEPPPASRDSPFTGHRIHRTLSTVRCSMRISAPKYPRVSCCCILLSWRKSAHRLPPAAAPAAAAAAVLSPTSRSQTRTPCTRGRRRSFQVFVVPSGRRHGCTSISTDGLLSDHVSLVRW